jgi:Ser/Thr protein kinase RdoA (MazF antagonist)
VTDAALVGRILREYRLGTASVRRRYGSVSGARVGYELEWPRGGAVLVRAYRADVPLPAHLRGSGSASVTDWLLGRAATLQWLAGHGYPAPRMVPTRSGDPIAVAGIWLTWAASYIPGRALPPDGQAGPLGAALGRLHALGAPGLAPGPGEPGPEAAPGGGEAAPGVAAAGPGRASWHPAAAIPAALRRLDAVATLLPEDWRPLHAQFRSTLLAVRRAAPGLPMTVVHGGTWPGNAVVTARGEVTLIDWEDGGLGLPVLDLGHCLLGCHLAPGPPAPGLPAPGLPAPGRAADQPGAWRIEPDPGRIAAVLDGYARWRRLADAEREVLAEGIRFGAAYAGAIHFEQALVDGVHGAAMDARLGRLRNRIAVSQAVADLAARHLATR